MKKIIQDKLRKKKEYYMNKKYLTPEELAEVKKIDLLTYLFNYEPNELIRKSRNEYSTKSHSSLRISNGLWTWWAKGIGGRSALDYLIKVEDMSFIEAALLLNNCITNSPPTMQKVNIKKQTKYHLKLPMRSQFPLKMYQYLMNKRGIDKEIVDYYTEKNMIYEAEKDHSVIFVGYNNQGVPAFASKRSTTNDERRNLFGSDKRYSFELQNDFSSVLHIFESPIDLMSFQTMQKMNKKDWNTDNYLSIDGATLIGKNIIESEIPVALEEFLMNHGQVTDIILHLDNDRAGYETSEKIKYHLGDRYKIEDKRPKKLKDINEILVRKMQKSQEMIR